MIPLVIVIVVVTSFFALKNVAKAGAKRQQGAILLSIVLEVIAFPIATHAGNVLSASFCNNPPATRTVSWVLAGSTVVVSLYNLYVAVKHRDRTKQVVVAALFVISSLFAAFAILLLSSFCFSF